MNYLGEIELSEQDIEIARENFSNKQDVDGLISRLDLAQVLRECGVTVMKTVLEDKIKVEKDSFDKNNGLCDWNTFIRLYKKCISDQPDEEVLLNAIKMLVPPGRQAVPSSEMRKILMSFGDVFTAREADEFISECDQFGTGEIDPETVTAKLVANDSNPWGY